jgi:nitroreductase
MDTSEFRKPAFGCDPLFVNRWSPRAMSGEALTREELFTLFEAARWAPSSNNNQPWRFLYAERDTEYWPVFFDLLTDANKVWAEKAAVLAVVVSKTTFDHNDKYSRTHSYDAGAAWENLALQGSMKGLVVHGMQGFNYDKAKAALNVPDTFQVEAMIAVGKPGKKEDLPEHLQAREFPSPRKEMAAIACEGLFRF